MPKTVRSSLSSGRFQARRAGFKSISDGDLVFAGLVELRLRLPVLRLGVRLLDVRLLGRVRLLLRHLLLVLRLLLRLHLVLWRGLGGGDGGGRVVALEAHEVDDEDDGGREDEDPSGG